MDSTSHYCIFPKAMNQTVFGWLLQELEEDKPYIEPKDFEKVKNSLAPRRAGFGHVQEQHAELLVPRKEGPCKFTRHQVFIRLLVVQRNNASCTCKSFDMAVPELDEAALKDVAKKCPKVLFQIAACVDAGSANLKMANEIRRSFRGFDNVVFHFWFCKGHDISNSCKDLYQVHDTTTFLRSLSNVMRTANAHNLWLAHIIKVIPHCIPTRRLPKPADQIALSDEFF